MSTTKTKRTPDLAVIYYDTTDPRNKGWAYNVVVDGDHESDALPHRRLATSLDTLLRSLRREFRAGQLAVPDINKWREARDGNGWEARS